MGILRIVCGMRSFEELNATKCKETEASRMFFGFQMDKVKNSDIIFSSKEKNKSKQWKDTGNIHIYP